MFGRKKTGDLDRLLNDDPNPDFEKVISCQDFPSDYRDQSQPLMDYLLRKEVLMDLLDKLMTTNKRDFHQKVTKQLLQASNQQLHRVCAWNQEFMKKALSALDPVEVGGKIDEQQTAYRMYGAATIERLLSRACDNFNGLIEPIFRANGGELYKKIVMNIGTVLVGQTVEDMTSDQHDLRELMYHIWRKIVSEIGPSDFDAKPRYCKDLDFGNEMLDETSRHRAIERLARYFKIDLEKARDFAKIVLRWVNTRRNLFEEYPDLMNLAAVIRAKNKVRDGALRDPQAHAEYNRAARELLEYALSNVKDNSPLSQNCFAYIAAAVTLPSQVPGDRIPTDRLEAVVKHVLESDFDQVKVQPLLEIVPAVDKGVLVPIVNSAYEKGLGPHIKALAAQIAWKCELIGEPGLNEDLKESAILLRDLGEKAASDQTVEHLEELEDPTQFCK